MDLKRWIESQAIGLKGLWLTTMADARRTNQYRQAKSLVAERRR
jgi:hypothetical protein